MYPAIIDVTKTHEIHQDAYLGDFHFQNIFNGLVDFADGREGCDPNEKRAIAWLILCIIGIAIHW